MAKSSNPKLPKLTFQKLITAGSASSSRFAAKGLAEDLGLKGGTASVEAKAVTFGAPSSRSTSSSSSESSGGSALSGTLTGYLSNVLGSSAFGSIFTGLSSLFGFGGGSAPAALVRFSLPDPLAMLGAIPASAGIAASASLAAHSGRVTAIRSLAGTNLPTASDGGATRGIGAVPRGNTGGAGGHQFHFHVSAMDTQSFVDRSSDIAKAVKTAMLQSNSLNDVVAET